MIVCEIEDRKGRTKILDDVDSLEFHESSSTFTVRMGGWEREKAEMFRVTFPLKITVTVTDELPLSSLGGHFYKGERHA